jgi:hypothetical protein
MRQFLSSCLVLGGAVAGGVFPGALIAWCLVASSRLSGSAGEACCFVANLIFGVAGALCGSLLARWIYPGATWRYNVLLVVVSGLAAGSTGYLWLDWVVSHAELPL